MCKYTTRNIQHIYDKYTSSTTNIYNKYTTNIQQVYNKYIKNIWQIYNKYNKYTTSLQKFTAWQMYDKYTTTNIQQIQIYNKWIGRTLFKVFCFPNYRSALITYTNMKTANMNSNRYHSWNAWLLCGIAVWCRCSMTRIYSKSVRQNTWLLCRC